MCDAYTNCFRDVFQYELRKQHAVSVYSVMVNGSKIPHLICVQVHTP